MDKYIFEEFDDVHSTNELLKNIDPGGLNLG
jgi:hypothetical protein